MASLAVVSVGKLRRCGADNVGAFARGGVKLSSASGWDARWTCSQSICSTTRCNQAKQPRTQRMVGDIVVALAFHK